MERLANLLKQPKTQVDSLIGWLKSIHHRLWSGIGQLNTPQKLYGLALILLSLPDTNWPLVCIFTLLALGLEFWPRFTRIWHSLLGKSCLLFFYAIVANFALVSAASIVNDVSGIAAEHLPYTHNLVILMYLPVWIIGFTFLALLFLQVLSPLYILAILILRPFGIRAVKFLSQSKFPVLTTLVRMGLSLVLLMQLIALNEKNFVDLSKQLNGVLDGVVQDTKRSQLAQDNAVQEPGIQEDDNGDLKSELLPEQEALPKQVDNDMNEVASLSSELGDSAFGIQLNTDEQEQQMSIYYSYRDVVLVSLNSFIYALEADNFSRCQFEAPSRVVEINDYEMLTVTPDNTADYGFSYKVEPCRSVGIHQSTNVK